MKKNYFLFAVISTLLLVGAGCSFGKSETTASSTPKEAVIDTTLQQEAYLFCTQKGYDIQIRFVVEQNRNIAYCIFDKDTECESVDFLHGTCPGTASTTPEVYTANEGNIVIELRLK